MSKKLRVGDLFSGIGGWGHSIEYNEFLKKHVELVWVLDDDAKACKIHKMNHPDTTVHNTKIHHMDANDLEPVDILVGSPPCVNFSSARQKTKKVPDDGLELLRRFLSIRDTLQPKAWAFENVTPLLKYIPKLTDELGKYYTLKMLGTHYGIPQKRRRLIVSSHMINPILDLTPSFSTLGQVISMLDGKLGRLPHHSLHEVKDKDILTLFKKKMMKEKAGLVLFPDRLDFPARTIVAQPSPVGREPIIILDTSYNPNKLRYLSQLEMAVIQGFPIWYNLGDYSRTKTIKLIGNAFPPPMASVVLHNLCTSVM